VTNIFSEKDPIAFIQQHQFDGGGADVNACAVYLHEKAS
jgi:hypothetical protein